MLLLQPVWRQSSHSPLQIRQVSPHSATKKPASSTQADKNSKKSPRTVHIDVYCTGSEADEDEDESFSTDSISPSTSQSSLDLVQQHTETTHSHQRSTSTQRAQAFNDDDEAGSNSTPQTVFNATQMRLHHSRRNSRQTLPRRIVNQMMLLDQALPTQPGRLRQYILDQANEKDEINVSKMMLFDKHMGDVKTTSTAKPSTETGSPSTAAASLSSPGSARKFSFARYATAAPEPANSEMEYSSASAYPNSSRSTFRDPTWSSLSSAMASSSAVFEDLESFGPMASNLSTTAVSSTRITSTGHAFERWNRCGWIRRAPPKVGDRRRKSESLCCSRNGWA